MIVSDVVIAGAGISGLYAALKCIENGYRVILLEKSERLGGRIKTVYHAPFQYEAGAGRFSQNHKILRRLLKEFNLHEYPISKGHNFQGESSPDHVLLDKVLADTAKYTDEYLRSISFKHLCRLILGKESTDTLIKAFGYNAEFDLSNAYDALVMFKRDFKYATKYYGCLEGLSELVARIHKKILDADGRCYLETRVVDISDVSHNGHSYKSVVVIDANGRMRTYNTRTVICALPQAALKEFTFFNKDQKRLINSVVPVSLHRIYGQFPMQKSHTWFDNIPKTTTGNQVRQFIPIDKKSGLAMISYSDTRYADKWKSYADQGTNALEQRLLKDLHVVFPSIKKIPRPSWIQSFYWPAGVHLWKRGSDSKTVIDRLQTMSNRVFVVGEAYCRNPGWIEGALESVDAVLPLLYSYLSDTSRTGGYANRSINDFIKHKRGKLNNNDLQYIKSTYKDFEWVLLRPNKEDQKTLWLIDTNIWKTMHPGGNVFDARLHKDVSEEFYQVPYHIGWDGKLKPDVYARMKKYKRATVRL